MRDFALFWAPVGGCIDIVSARKASSAKRKAPQPYRKYLGEIYVVELVKPRMPCESEKNWVNRNVDPNYKCIP